MRFNGLGSLSELFVVRFVVPRRRRERVPGDQRERAKRLN